MVSVSLLYSLIFVLLVSGQAIAADSTPVKTYEIRLKVGAESVKINGETVKVQKTYKDKTTVMAPISVITRAFGAVLSWDPKAQTIGLKYSSYNIQMKIGSNQATVNDKKSTLPALPKMINNVVMIPIQFVAEAFGAKVTTDAKSGEMIIKGTLANAENSNTAINPDAGKTTIGNSYYKWSIKYPTGLVKGDTGFKEEWIEFVDAKGEYTIYINCVEEATVNLSKSALLKNLSDNIEDTILEKKTVTEADKTYARIVTKNSNGSISEVRAYFREGHIFYVNFTVNKSENYKNTSKYKGYKDLMDSFKTTFDAGDKSLKDISTVKDGYRKYSSTSFGYSLNLPADWEMDDESVYFFKDNRDLGIVINSISEDDTLQKWKARGDEDFLDTFTGDYGKSISTLENKTAGAASIIQKNEYSYGNDKWWVENKIYIFKGNYKYYFKYTYLKDETEAESQAIFNKIKKSIAIDLSKIDSSLGYIEDESETIDETEMMTRKNKEYKYQIEIPVLWVEDEESDDVSVIYKVRGGYFQLWSYKDITYDETVKFLHDKLFDAAQDNSEVKIEETDTTLAGVLARKVVVTDKSEDITYQSTQYILSKNNITYLFILYTEDWAATEANLKQINDTLNTFTFIE